MPGLDHFGIIAPYYDRAIPLKYAERLIELVDLPAQGLVLDAGGGTGRVAQALQGKAGGVVVADLSAGMLRQARAKNGLALVQAHTELLAFADGSFDRVIMVDALHHVISHQETAFELWRVLKAGGRIVILEPDIRKNGVKLVALLEKMLLMRSHFLAPEAIRSLFNSKKAHSWTVEDGFNAWVVINKSVEESPL